MVVTKDQLVGDEWKTGCIHFGTVVLGVHVEIGKGDQKSTKEDI